MWDEFVAKMLAVVDEELSIERVRQMMLVTFQQSFSQQDMSAGDVLSQDSLPPTLGLFFKPWKNPEFAAFFSSDVGKDIRGRWPAAMQKYYEESDALREAAQTRLRQLAVEYQAKIKSSGSKE